MVGGVPMFQVGNGGAQEREVTWSLRGLKGSVVGRSLSPDSPQMTVPTFGSGVHSSGTSRMALCPCRSGSSTRRSGAGSG